MFFSLLMWQHQQSRDIYTSRKHLLPVRRLTLHPHFQRTKRTHDIALSRWGRAWNRTIGLTGSSCFFVYQSTVFSGRPPAPGSCEPNQKEQILLDSLSNLCWDRNKTFFPWNAKLSFITPQINQGYYVFTAPSKTWHQRHNHCGSQGLHPGKMNGWNPKSWRFGSDDVPFQLVNFYVPAASC